VPRSRRIVGVDGVLTEPDELLVFESDGLTIFRATADAVVFPRSTAEVAACVQARERGGAALRGPRRGDGPRRGCLPSEGGIVIAVTRMARILEVDYANQLAVVEPGS
jgi:glycolate oxidase